MSDTKTHNPLIAILIVIAVVVAGYFLLKNAPATIPEETSAEDTEAIIIETNQEENPMDTQPTTTQNNQPGLKITVTQEGTGEGVKNGQTVSMNYIGRFEDGKVFDTNVGPTSTHPEPLEFVLGAGMVISGWDKGILGMKVGEKRTLVISPELGYGPNDYGPIPGGSTLIFDVELLGFK